MDSLEVEYTLLQKPDIKAYEIPPSARSTGHLAEEWTKQILHGKLKVSACGKTCLIQLLTKDNQLFVACPVDPLDVEKSVERVRDSTRYFVLRVVGPNGQHAFIGMGFDERNDAFDFWASLVDFGSQIKQEEKASETSESSPDLSHLQLNQGQTISLGGAAKKPKSSGKGLIKLQPPK